MSPDICIEIEVEDVSSTENSFEGFTMLGRVVRAFGTLAHRGEEFIFEGKITEPKYLKTQACTATITDTKANLSISTRSSIIHRENCTTV